MKKLILLLALAASMQGGHAVTTITEPQPSVKRRCSYAENNFANLAGQPTELIGKKITLRTTEETHFDGLDCMCSDVVREALDWPINVTNIASANLWYFRADYALAYTIFDNADHNIIGEVTVLYKHVSYEPEYGQLGIWINEHYWGGGRGLETISLVSKAYFALYPDQLTLSGTCSLTNARSHNVQLKARFVDDGFIYTTDGKPKAFRLKLSREKSAETDVQAKGYWQRLLTLLRLSLK